MVTMNQIYMILLSGELIEIESIKFLTILSTHYIENWHMKKPY